MSKVNKVLTRATVVCAAALLSSAASAQAVIAIDSIQARAGDTVSIPLILADGPASAGFNAEVRIPSHSQITGVTGGSLITSGFSFGSSYDQQVARMLAYSSSGSFSGEGELATVQIQVGEEAIPGNYVLEVSSVNPDPLVNSRYALSSLDGMTSLPASGQSGNLYVYTYSSDFDGDELPDNWEIANGLNHLSGNGNDGATGDGDGDGISNLEEFLTGTDPQDGQSGPETANGVNYVFFRDHFNDQEYLDRWFVGLTDDGALFNFAEDTITDNGDEKTILDTDLAQPGVANTCETIFLQSIGTVDMDVGVMMADLRAYGAGRTSVGLSANGDLGTRVELQFNDEEAPYFILRSFENGVENPTPQIFTTSYENQNIEVKLAKNGTDFSVHVNGLLQAIDVKNNVLGDADLQPFVAAESCATDSDAVDTYIESVELLRDTDADALPDLYEDVDLNRMVSEGESDLFIADTDGDLVLDGFDNCVLDDNNLQVDADNDGYGNICDADLNNDCNVNVVDLGILRSVFFTADPVADMNADGVVNVVDLGLLRSMFFMPPGPSGTRQQCD